MNDSVEQEYLQMIRQAEGIGDSDSAAWAAAGLHQYRKHLKVDGLAEPTTFRALRALASLADLARRDGRHELAAEAVDLTADIRREGLDPQVATELILAVAEEAPKHMNGRTTVCDHCGDTWPCFPVRLVKILNGGRL